MRSFKPVLVAVALLTTTGSVPVVAEQDLQEFIPSPQLVGEGKLKVMFWDIYDARLYAPEGEWSPGSPFALTLKYHREFTAEQIADRSVEEIRSQGFRDELKLADWHSQMRALFPNVVEGDQLTGVSTGTGESIFYLNGKRIGSVTDRGFSQHFFGIWLSDKTSAPGLRKKLLGAL